MNNDRLSVFVGNNKIISKNGREGILFITRVNRSFDSIPEISGQLFNVDPSRFNMCSSDNIERVIFNDPATVVYWKDGTKTVVKCQPGDEYDDEKGLALCIAKKYLGNKGNFNNVFKKFLIRPDEVDYLKDGIPVIGTKIKIITTRNGCRGAEGYIGTVTNSPHSNGMLKADPGYNVALENGEIWRINSDAKIEIIREE